MFTVLLNSIVVYRLFCLEFVVQPGEKTSHEVKLAVATEAATEVVHAFTGTGQARQDPDHPADRQEQHDFKAGVDLEVEVQDRRQVHGGQGRVAVKHFETAFHFLDSHIEIVYEVYLGFEVGEKLL